MGRGWRVIGRVWSGSWGGWPWPCRRHSAGLLGGDVGPGGWICTCVCTEALGHLAFSCDSWEFWFLLPLLTTSGIFLENPAERSLPYHELLSATLCLSPRWDAKTGSQAASLSHCPAHLGPHLGVVQCGWWMADHGQPVLLWAVRGEMTFSYRNSHIDKCHFKIHNVLRRLGGSVS